MYKTIKLSAVALATLFMLVGCYIPEKFTASLEFRPDASYQFLFSGSTIHGMAAMAIKDHSWTSRDDETLKKEAVAMVAQKSFIKKAEYQGNGRTTMEIEFQGKPGEKMRMFDIFQVFTDVEGVTNVGVSKISPKNAADLKQVGIKVDGNLSVNIPKNAQVISHNATSTPTFGFGSYGWKIGSIDQSPFIKFKISR